ncbi:MAG: DUF2336 domain-containing protein [Mesorhizobium sp.]|nr:MAG: DUF2336 domain-containing protein [Mesorhizobium sp.]
MFVPWRRETGPAGGAGPGLCRVSGVSSVSSSDFRHIAIRTEAGKAERLFRAAVSAFCSLTRPSRREIAQLEDLTLAEEPVEIAAPLLTRSNALSDIDLIALIGRHGLPHARAIARRKELNATIAHLIRALEKPTLVNTRPPETVTKIAPVKPAASATEDNRPDPGVPEENARRRLRSMMRPAGESAAVNLFLGQPTYLKLRETALTGNLAFFQTALADALDIDFATARSITEQSGYAALLAALKALDLSEDRAFLIAVAVHPGEFPHPQAIRLFLDRYRLLHREAALDKVRAWKAETLSRAIRGNAIETGRHASNSDDKAAGRKAS